MVDDFGVKCVGEAHANHLIQALKKDCDISEDWKGLKYCGLSLDLDYDKREVHLSMPGYVEKALARFKHERPKKSQDQPHQHTIPTYGAKIQYAKREDDTNELDKNGKQYVQQVVDTFLFYGRAVDSTERNSIQPSSPNRSNNEEDQAVPRLCSDTPRCSIDIQSQ